MPADLNYLLQARRNRYAQPAGGASTSSEDPRAAVEEEAFQAEKKRLAAAAKEQEAAAEDAAKAYDKGRKDAEKEALRVRNNEMEAKARREKRPIYTDADGVIQSQYTDDEWEAQKKLKAKNDRLRTQYFKEQRPWVEDAEGNMIPRHTDEEWQALQSEKAAKEKAKQLDEQAKVWREQKGQALTTVDDQAAQVMRGLDLEGQDLTLQHKGKLDTVKKANAQIKRLEKEIEDGETESGQILDGAAIAKRTAARQALVAERDKVQAETDAAEAKLRAHEVRKLEYSRANNEVQGWLQQQKNGLKTEMPPVVMGVKGTEPGKNAPEFSKGMKEQGNGGSGRRTTDFTSSTAGGITQLTPEEEQKFQKWKSQNAPEDTGADYDLRGAFKEGESPDGERGHFPDTFKLPNHPTFSKESKYSTPDKPGGEWGESNGKTIFTPSAWMASDPERMAELKRYFKEVEPDAQLILPNTTQSPLQTGAPSKEEAVRKAVIEGRIAALAEDDSLSDEERKAGLTRLMLQRDDPKAYETQVMQEFEGLPPEQLNQTLEGHLQDFDQRKQDWQARRDALRQQTQAVNAEVEGVLARNAQRLQQPHKAADLITYTTADGGKVSVFKDLVPQLEQAQEKAGTFEKQHQAEMDQINAEGGELERAAKLIHAGGGVLQKKQEGARVAAQAERQKVYDQLNEIPGAKLGDELAQVDAAVAKHQGGDDVSLHEWAAKEREKILQKAKEMPQQAQKFYQEWAKGMDYDWSDLKPEDIAVETNMEIEAKKYGIMDKAGAKHWLTTMAQADWSVPNKIGGKEIDPAKQDVRFLPNGNITVNPGYLLDKEGYEQVVKDSKATPEAKKQALAVREQIAPELATQALTALRQNSDMADWLKKNTSGTDLERMEQFTAKMKAGGWTTAAQMRFQAAAAGIGASWMGAAGAVTGSDTFLQADVPSLLSADWWKKRADAYGQAAGVAEKGTGVLGKYAAMAVGGLPSVLESVAAGSVVGGVAKLAKAGKLATTLNAATKAKNFKQGQAAIDTFNKGIQTLSMAGAAIDAGIQQGGSTFNDAYQHYLEQELGKLGGDETKTPAKEEIEQAKATARKEALKPALLDALQTAGLTALGGARGAEALLRTGADEAVKKAFKTGLGKVLAGIGMDAGEEFLEEYANQFVSGVIAQATYNPKMTVKEVFSQALDAGIVGGLLGGGMGSVKALGDYRAEKAAAGFISDKGMKEQGNGGTGRGPTDFTSSTDGNPEPAKAGTTLQPEAGGQNQSQLQTGAPSTEEPEAGSQNTLKREQPTLAEAQAELASFAPKGMEAHQVAATKTKAEVLLRMAQGETLEDFDDEELRQVGLNRDGTPGHYESVPVDKKDPQAGRTSVWKKGVRADGFQPVVVEDGELIITQRQIDNLGVRLPAVAAQIGKSEVERRREIAGKGLPQEEAQPDSGTGGEGRKKAQEPEKKRPESGGGQDSRITGLGTDGDMQAEAAKPANEIIEDWDRKNRHQQGSEWFEGGRANAEVNAALDRAAQTGGADLQTHGMAKEATLTGALRNLKGLLTNGLNKARNGGVLHTAPLAVERGSAATHAGTTSGGTSYRDGPFILVASAASSQSDVGIRDMANVHAVLVNDANKAQFEAIRAEIHAIRPDMIVDLMSNADKVAASLTQKFSQVVTSQSQSQLQTGAPSTEKPVAFDPAVEQRVDEISAELAGRGLSGEQALKAARGVVRRMGVMGPKYEVQMIDPAFEEAMKAEGFQRDPAKMSRWMARGQFKAETQAEKPAMRKAEAGTSGTGGRQDSQNSRISGLGMEPKPASPFAQATEDTKAGATIPGNQSRMQVGAPSNEASKPEAGSTAQQPALIERSDWKQRQGEVIAGMQARAKGLPEAGKKAAGDKIKAVVKRFNKLEELIDTQFGRLFEGVRIVPNGSLAGGGGLAAQVTGYDAQGRATGVELLVDAAAFAENGGITDAELERALNEEWQHRADLMVMSRSEAIALARDIHAAQPGVFHAAWKQYYAVQIKEGSMPAKPPVDLTEDEAYRLYFEASRMIRQGTFTSENAAIRDVGLLQRMYLWLSRYVNFVRREMKRLPQDLRELWEDKLTAAEAVMGKTKHAGIRLQKEELDDFEPEEQPQKGAKTQAKKERVNEDEEAMAMAADAEMDMLSSARKQAGYLSSAPFYSKLAQVIEQKMPARADAKTIKGILTNPSSAIKAEELKWSGIVPWVEGQQGTVTKAVVLEYLRTDGEVRLEEHTTTAGPRWTVRDSQSRETFDSEEEAAAEREQWIELNMKDSEWENPDPSEWEVVGDEEGGYRVEGRRGSYIADFETEESANKYVEAAIEARDDEEASKRKEWEKEVSLIHESDAGKTKYSQYQLPGGTNYREVVLAMPPKKKPSFRVAEAGPKSLGRYFDTEEQAEVFAQKMRENGASPIITPMMVEDTKSLYHSNHFSDIPNYVAHMRLNDRTDSAGQPGTFIEEIQSDRHQQGREQGYGLHPMWAVRDRHNTLIADSLPSKEAAEQAAREHPGYSPSWSVYERPMKQGVPDAPFRTTWPLQMFKRALVEAVRTGKKWIGWTMGETQNDRYDLGKQIDAINYSGSTADGWTLQLIKDGEQLNEMDVEDAKLADTVGKDVAQRMREGVGSEGLPQGMGHLSGLDLQVGGDGMKGFYDNILPKEVGKYVKQWGAGVAKGEIHSDQDASGNWITSKEEGTHPIWRVEITPQMRAGVEAGQALFSPRKQGLADKGVETIDAAAHEAATSPRNDLPEPTPAQKEAGNYAKGHVSIGGHEISIENPAGSRRRPEWPVLKDHYGYLKGTVGQDGDHVDVFVKPGTDTGYDGPVHVVRQNVVEEVKDNQTRRQSDKETGTNLKATGKLDEYKVMMGYPTAEEARAAYLRNYTKGWPGLAKLTTHTMPEFEVIKRSVFGGAAGAMATDKALASPRKQGQVTPLQDAEYMQAVKDGDVAKQQAMVAAAAKAAGYNVGPVLHGTAEDFTVFDTTKRAGNTAEYGRGLLFFTDEPKLATEYSKTGSGKLKELTGKVHQAIEEWSDYAYELLPQRMKHMATWDNAHRLPTPLNDLLDSGQITRVQYDRFYELEDKVYSLNDQLSKLENPAGKPRVMRVYLKIPKLVEEDAGDRGLTFGSWDVVNTSLAEQMEAEGADGFLAKNVYDSPFGTEMRADVYAVRSPNQIKSADPITRDAEGNVIPLSQRFNPESDSILYAPRKQGKALEMLAKADWGRIDKALTGRLAAAVTDAAQWIKKQALPGEAQVNPVDAALELLAGWSVEGQAAASGAKFKPAQKQELMDQTRRQMRRVWNMAVRQLVPDASLPADVLAKKREMTMNQGLSNEVALDIGQRALAGKPKLSDLVVGEAQQNPEIRRKMFLAMNPKIDSGVTMDSLSPEERRVAEALLKLRDDLGRRMVKAGRIGLQTYEAMREGTSHYYDHDVKREKSLMRQMSLGLRNLFAQTATAFHIVDTQTKQPDGSPALVMHPGSRNRPTYRFDTQEQMRGWYEEFIKDQILQAAEKGNAGRYPWMTPADKAALMGVTRDSLNNPGRMSAEQRAVVARLQEQLRARFEKRMPLSYDEHSKAGLIEDPFYSVARQIAEMGHDVATAEFFNSIAAVPDYVRDAPTIGYTEMPDTAKLGALAGKYVRDDVAAEVQQLTELPGLGMKFYDALLGLFKTGKTVLNPGSHGRNIVGNIAFAHLAGSNPLNPGNATYYAEALRVLRDGGAEYREMYEKGVLGGDFLTGEVKRSLRQLVPDAATVLREAESGNMSWLYGLKEHMARRWQGLLKKPGQGLELAATAWRLEDDIYKTAAYLKAKSMGMTSQQAAEHVREWFPYYDKGTSGTLKALGRFAFPFLSFKRESFRILKNGLTKKPLATIATLALPRLLTQIALTMAEMRLLMWGLGLGLKDERDKEDVLKALKGRAGRLLSPIAGDSSLFSILLPWRDANGGLQQWDLSNTHPFGDWLATRTEDAESKEPWITRQAREMVSGTPFLGLLVESAFNKDSFTGRRIYEDDMSPGEATGKLVEHAFTELAPPIAPTIPLPGGVKLEGTSARTIRKAFEQSPSKLAPARNPTQALIRTLVGLDVRPADPNLYDDVAKYRKEHNLPAVARGQQFPSDAVGRARAELYRLLIQPEPDVTAVKAQIEVLTKHGAKIPSVQDLFKDRQPQDVMKLKKHQARWMNQLAPEARRVLEAAQKQQSGAKEGALDAMAKARAGGA